MRKFFNIFFIIILLFSLKTFAQKGDKVEFIEGAAGGPAGSLSQRIINGEKVQILKDNVGFRQKDIYMYCDSAYKYTGKSRIEAFGHVKILQGDSLTLTGDRLDYYSDTKMAYVKGHVVLRDKVMTLTTEALDYNMSSKYASYRTGGKIVDQKSILTSQFGDYDTQNKMLYFKKNVKVISPGFTLFSDTVEYSTQTKVAVSKGFSRTITPEREFTSNYGEYDTRSNKTVMKGRSKVESGSYILSADIIDYDKKNGRGVATGNVKATSIKDNIIIEGDKAYYWGNKGTSKIFGHALMKKATDKDTLYLTADTLHSIDNEIKAQKRLLAYNNAKIYRTDLQGICDSLVYNFADSTIYFYRQPVLWSERNQIVADSINIQMVNNTIDRMNMRLNSFIISQDTLKNYNQVKGRNMTAFFADEAISRVNIDGNGENIYFVLEGDTALIGMNKVKCSDMVIRFGNKKLSTIKFITNPDASFIPPHELLEPEKKLKGFSWKEKDKPTKEMVMGIRKK